MSQRYFGDWLRAFVEYGSYGEAPTKMIFWTGVSTIAGALRRRVWIDQKYFQWFPNFYTIFVAKPGIVSKTTTANIGMNLLRGLPQGTINFGPDSVTWQSLVTSLAGCCESVPNPYNPGEFYPMSAVTFCSDELGNLLTPSDDKLVSALITLWDGKQGEFRKETKGSGNDKIENPWVNIIGCTTPAWIGGNIPDQMIGGGLTSRMVFVYAEKKRQFVAYPAEAVPKHFDEFKKRLVHDLEVISQLFGEFRLEEKAKVWGRDWYNNLWNNLPEDLNNDQFAGYLARKQTHLHKLAMVLSVSQDNDLAIKEHHLQHANEILEVIEGDMPRVFARIGDSIITRCSTEIRFLVESQPGISVTQLYKYLFRKVSHREFAEALAGAVNAGFVQMRQVNNLMQYYPVGKAPGNESQDPAPH